MAARLTAPYIDVRGEPASALNSRFQDDAGDFGAWSGQMLLARSNGRVYEVIYSGQSTRDYPSHVGIHLPGGEGRWLCSFQSAGPTPRLRSVRDGAARLCADVERRRTAASEDLPFTPVESRALGGERYVRAEGAVDFMNDGDPRRLLMVDFSSGAGAGCETSYFSLADPHAPEAEATPLRDLQGLAASDERYPLSLPNGSVACRGNVARFHRIDSSVVFEQRFPGERPQRHDHEFWWVSRVENGRAVRLCEATLFEPRPRTIEYNSSLYPSAR